MPGGVKGVAGGDQDLSDIG